MEKYYFLRIYSMDFQEVLESIKLLKDIKPLEIRCRLLRDIAVSYSRPFSVNRGNVIRKDQCPEEVIPKALKGLHEEIFTLRKERFAHSDLNHYGPKLARWKTNVGWTYPMTFRGFDYAKLDKKLPDVELLVNKVVINLQAEIEKYHQWFDERIES